MLFTGRRTAELTKYAANAFLAMKISFINEMADLCEAVDADVQDLARGIGLDNRIGAEIPPRRPGLWRKLLSQGHAGAAPRGRGSRGRAAHHLDRRRGQRRRARRRWSTGSSRRSAEASTGKRVGVLGLTFKPNTDDMRDAPSIPLVDGAGRARRRGRRPSTRSGASRPSRCCPRSTYADDAEDVADGADAVVIVTEWDEFRALSLRDLAKRMRGDALVDLRNIYDRAEAAKAGLRHFGIGRGRQG